MNSIQNLCIGRPTPFNKALAQSTRALAIATIALSIIGLTATSSGPFNAIVQFGTTNNGILLGASIFILILDLVWIAALCKKKNASDIQSELAQRCFPLIQLSDEIFLKILSYLNENEIETCSLVSKEWKRIASDEALLEALCLRGAFGKEKWTTYFGDIGEQPPLPPNIRQILKSRPSFLNGNSVEETFILVLIPSSINGKPLTLNSIGSLVKLRLQGNSIYDGYRYIGSEIIAEYGDKSVNASYWVLMSKGILPESRNKNYSAQQELVKKYSEIAQMEYRIPNILEAIVCIFTEFVSSGECLYSDSPWTYTCCQEESQGYHVIVGGFNWKGLFVSIDVCGGNDGGRGVGILQEFSKSIVT